MLEHFKVADVVSHVV